MQSDPVQGDKVFDEFWPEARAISDTDKVLYEAFGLSQGSRVKLFSPSLWKRSMEAYRKGFRQDGVMGDAMMMPGLFLVFEGEIVWSHDYKHFGDKPNYFEMAEMAKSTRSRA